MKARSEGDPIPQAAREVLTLFQERSEELAFPDVNIDTLQELEQALEQAGQEVLAAQQELEHARNTRQTREAELLALARRAFAYARVFAETDPELADALRDMEFAKPERSERKERTPARRRKQGSPATPARPSGPSQELPFDTDMAQA